jgi:hypothetical protein
MKRRLPRFLTRFWFLSLLLCIAILVIWAISQRITTPATPSTFAIQAALSKRIPQVSFMEAQFRDRLDFLSDQTGIQFELDAEALDPIDYSGTQQGIRFAATNATVGEILSSMQTALSPSLHFWTHGSEIRLSVKGTPWHAWREERREPDFVFQYQQKTAGKPTSLPHPLWEGVAGSHRYTLVTARGGLRLWITPPDPAAIYQRGIAIGNASDPEGLKVFDFAGLSLRRSGSPLNTRLITVPFWLFAAITAIPPLLALRRKLHERRCWHLARCPSCGYDLRATPNRCPECGRARPQPTATASALPPP